MAAGIFLGGHPPAPGLFLSILASGWLTAAAACWLGRDRWFLWAVSLSFAIIGLALGARANDAALRTALGTLFDRHVAPPEYQTFATLEGTLRADASSGPNGVTLSLAVDRIEFDDGDRTTSGGAIIGVGGGLASGRGNECRG